MYFWIPFAFVRIVVFFVAGILIGIFVPVSIPLLPVVIIFLMTALGYACVASSSSLLRLINPGFIGLFAILLAGFINVQLHRDADHVNHIGKLPAKSEYYKAVITSYVQSREKSWKAEARVLSVRTDSTWRNYHGKVLLYFSKELKSPSYGDILIVEGSPQEVKSPMNPGEFDYKQFLAFRNIHHQHFIRPGHVMVVANEPPNLFMAKAIDVRIWADRMLQKFVEGERQQAIASALVLGITDGLDHELTSAYGATGTLHVLAVSGLHISIIYMIIGFLLKPLNNSSAGKWVIAVISIVMLWGYAFVTGLSPSVLRAVTMFTFVALAKPWKQKVNIYNSLAASAFLLLLFDPLMIMSVGFQLSYLAVLGIVYLQPRLYQWWEPDSRLLDEIWKVTSVSIAAQIATLPLGLLYFHQFPNYFLFSNLLVIPASFVVLIAGLLILVLGFISVIGEFLGLVLTWTVKAMNFVVFTFEEIPFSKVDNIMITPLQALLLTVIIVSILLLFDQRKFYYSWMLLVVVVVFAGLEWEKTFDETGRARLTVYAVPQYSAIDLVDASSARSLMDSALYANPQKMNFHIQPARIRQGVRNVALVDEQDHVRAVPGGKMIAWRGKTIFILEKEIFPTKPIAVDYLILSRNAVTDLRELKMVAAKKIIVDSSNSFYLSEELLGQARELQQEIHVVLQQGAYHEIM